MSKRLVTLEEAVVVTRYLERELRRCPIISLQKVASELALHPAQVRHCVKRVYKVSFRRFRDRIFTSVVKGRLAATPEIQMKVIASDLGYMHAWSLPRRLRQLISNQRNAE